MAKQKPRPARDRMRQGPEGARPTPQRGPEGARPDRPKPPPEEFPHTSPTRKGKKFGHN